MCFNEARFKRHRVLSSKSKHKVNKIVNRAKYLYIRAKYLYILRSIQSLEFLLF